ncbi:hypothetical protein [Nocardiopsis sp. FR26]|uniref:hypothetical protein n=1 Tax=Nocardiopsis sp. FR26 TaxID=2605987 RepID=UPI001916B66C|nr:hypothetical protein [Nocardiopsis sp. FR26]
MPLSRVALAGLAASVALTLTGCGGDEPADTAEANGSDTVTVMFQLVTDSPMVAANHDDDVCMWSGETSYILRDGAGEVVATGDVKSDHGGQVTVGGEPALWGRVESTEPFECTLPFTVEDVPRADFYEVEVSTQAPRLVDEEYTATETFEAGEALSGRFEVMVSE